MRKAHYLKSHDSNKLPERVLYFDCETEESMAAFNVSHHKLTFGWCALTTRKAGRPWSKPRWHRFTTQAEFMTYLLSLTRKDSPLTIVAHNLEYDLSATGLLDGLVTEGWKMTQGVMSSPPSFFTWRKEGKTLKGLDAFNFFPCALKVLGAALRIEKLVMPERDTSSAQWDAYCRRDVEILMRAMQGWYALVQEDDLGSPAVSLPSQAFRAFRHRFMHHKILIDDHPKALDIARKGYFGGRVECFAIGEYHGRFHKVDINSMYPFVMHKCEYPTRLRTVWSSVSTDTLRKVLKDHCVSAYVQIRTDEPVYAIRTKSRLIFPIGEFDTHLSTPELLYGLEHNHILRCAYAAIYDRAPIFDAYVDYFYARRLKAKAEGNEMMSLMYKLFLNSLYGKFGQIGHKTIALDYDPGWTELVHVEIDADTGRHHYWRKVGGVWRSDLVDGESMDSHPSIAAHVTAYARMYLWDLISLAGLEHCYYCDTDSLIVDDIGLDRVVHLLSPLELGLLKHEGTEQNITVVNPKWYSFGPDIKLKGVRKGAEWLDSATIRQLSCRSLKGLLKAGDTNHNQWVTVTKHLNRSYKKGHVLPSGRTLPYSLPSDAALLNS